MEDEGGSFDGSDRFVPFEGIDEVAYEMKKILEVLIDIRDTLRRVVK